MPHPRTKAFLRLLIFLVATIFAIGLILSQIPVPAVKVPRNNKVQIKPSVPTREIALVELPEAMTKNKSNQARISIYPDKSSLPALAEGMERQEQPALKPIPGATPDVPLRDAYGPNYDAYATSSLSGPHFKITPEKSDPKPLISYPVEWDFAISPDQAGSQTLQASVNVEWRPKIGTGAVKQYQVMSSTYQYVIKEDRWISEGTEKTILLIVGILTLAISIPGGIKALKDIFSGIPQQDRGPS